MEYIMDSNWSFHGACWLFGAENLFTMFFVIFLIKEAKDLTDAQKKELYCPMKVSTE